MGTWRFAFSYTSPHSMRSAISRWIARASALSLELVETPSVLSRARSIAVDAWRMFEPDMVVPRCSQHPYTLPIYGTFGRSLSNHDDALTFDMRGTSFSLRSSASMLPEPYLTRAQECLENAMRAEDHVDRQRWIQAAVSWHMLAHIKED